MQMRRRKPSSTATWMLEHLSSGDRDEALAGDLLEEYCRGRSDGWYWQQVLAACAVSWLESLRTRTSLVVFTLIWSMLAPAWKMLCDGILDSPIVNHAWELAGGLWILPAFVLWAVLHSTFLWAGMLIYILCHGKLGKAFRRNQVSRAFLLAPLLFSPIYGAAFVLANLYWYSVFVNAKLAATPLGQIADLRMLADVIRIPYFIALLCALWAIPRSTRTSQPLCVETTPIEPPTLSETIAFVSTLDSLTLKRFFGFMVSVGLINAMIGGFLLCRLPASHSPSLSSLLLRAVLYVAVGALAGVVGTWLYWRNPSSPFRQGAPLPFTLFALVCAAGWVWVPSMAIFSEQISAGTAFVAMIGAFVLASGLRSATHFVFVSAPHSASSSTSADVGLFADSLARSSLEIHGYAIAISLYAAGAALLFHSICTAAALLALSAFLFAWKKTVPRGGQFVSSDQVRRATLRLVCIAIPAVLITAWALLDGVAHRNLVAQVNTASAPADRVNKSARRVSSSGLGGYESVILWPYPEKKQIIPPLPIHDSSLAPGTRKPIVIRFDGPYWYLQSPNKRPGPLAHKANGTPINADIQSNNELPLVMNAHQDLSVPIRTSRCREIQIEIENRDNKAGAISIALLLTDQTSPRKQTLYLGEQPIISTEPGLFSVKQSPAFETLRFSVPANGSIRKFSEITVLILSDIEHSFVAPKIAIQQFQLFPR